MATSNTARVSSMDGARFSAWWSALAAVSVLCTVSQSPNSLEVWEPRHSHEGGVCDRAAKLFSSRALSHRVFERLDGGDRVVFQDDAD